MVASVAARCAAGQRSWFNDLPPKWIERLIPLGVGLACFTITEVMHYLLVPDIGRRKERWLAEAVSAFLVSVLVAKVAAVVHRHYQVMLARTQVISEMNHHIRNAPDGDLRLGVSKPKPGMHSDDFGKRLSNRLGASGDLASNATAPGSRKIQTHVLGP